MNGLSWEQFVAHWARADKDPACSASGPGLAAWRALLSMDGQGGSKFYVIEVHCVALEYCLWTRWGRVGEQGHFMAVCVSQLADAVSRFERKYREKTGLAWAERELAPKAGKYRDMMQDVWKKRRQCCARAVVALVGLRRFRQTLLNSSPTDIVLLVGHALWTTRHDGVWEL